MKNGNTIPPISETPQLRAFYIYISSILNLYIR